MMTLIFVIFLITWALCFFTVIGMDLWEWRQNRKNTTTLTVADGTQFFAGQWIIIDPDMPNEERVKLISKEAKH